MVISIEAKELPCALFCILAGILQYKNLQFFDHAVNLAKCRSEGTIDLSDPQALDLCGFTVELLEAEEEQFVPGVRSDDIVGGKGGKAT